MKIAVCSDLHLEFGPITLENPGDVEVLILSGDIMVERDLMDHDPHNILDFKKSTKIHEFFYNCCNQFPHVVYVAGNHEHYHGDFDSTLKEIKRKLKYLPNLQVLNKESWTLHEEVVFVGGTLWTDMNKRDPLTMHSITGMMNDYQYIKNSARKVNYRSHEVNESGNRVAVFRERDAHFSAEDSVEDHNKMLEVIRKVYDETPPWMKIVVVGHHAPSKQSTHPRYKSEYMMNGAYSSELSDFILNRPGIKLWTHGHTHEDFDYMIGSTRIVCNPRGYIGYEGRADNFKLKVVEI